MKARGWLAIGLALGLVGGLIYAWGLAPWDYDTIPPLMHRTYREDWVRMTALAYGVEGNWRRTEVRLLDLPEPEVRRVLGETLDAAVAQGRSIDVLRRLARLAEGYGVESAAVAIYADAVEPPPPGTPRPGSPTPTRRPPTPTPTLSPTPTPLPPTPTPAPPSAYKVISQTLTCADVPQLAVSLVLSRTVEERAGPRVVFEALPGREVWLVWEDGADRAVTGFKPDYGLGYVDFDVEPGRVYRLYIDSPVGGAVSTLQVEPCTEEEGGGWISRWLIILEPEIETEESQDAQPTSTPLPGGL